MRDPLDVFFGDQPRSTYPGTLPPRRERQAEEASVLDGLRSREYLVDGVPTKFYTIGELSKALRRSPVTIRSWEAKGWLPTATFRAPPPRSQQIPGKALMGPRLYSGKQIEFLIDAFYAYKLDHPKNHDWPGFRQHIKNNYPRK